MFRSFTSKCSITSVLTSARFSSSTVSVPDIPIPSGYPGANKCETRGDTRVYVSRYPSIKPQAEKYKSVCSYMFECWQKVDQTTPAFMQAETEEEITYGNLRKVTERAAEVLYHGYSLRKGDVACIMLHNTIYYPTLVYGVIRLGATVTTTNSGNTADGLAHHLELSGSTVVISSVQYTSVVTDAVLKLKKEMGREVRILYVEDFTRMTSAPSIPASYTAMEEAKPDDVAFMPFSSGTTGSPKGVQLTHSNLVASIIQKGVVFPVYPSDRFLAVMPFFHIYGFTSIMSSGMTGGALQVLATKYHADTYLEYVQRFNISAAFVAPPIVASLVHRLESPDCKADISSLRYFMCSAAPLSNDMAARLAKLAPQLKVGQSWGMTEMSPTVSTYPRDDPVIDYRISGVLAPDTEMRVVKIDADQQSGDDKSRGVDVDKEGDEGELWVRGPQMMKGYLDPKQTAIAIQDGWYRTGDIGYIRSDIRAVVLSGRLKELIKYKGFQVSPPELEAELVKHPWVQDVVVIGVTDPRDVSFENARAMVVPKASVEKSKEEIEKNIYFYMRDRMPSYKALHGGVRVVDAIPRNATGKLLRRQAREIETEYIKIHGFPKY